MREKIDGADLNGELHPTYFYIPGRTADCSLRQLALAPRWQVITRINAMYSKTQVFVIMRGLGKYEESGVTWRLYLRGKEPRENGS
jgi:hypothetical protein